MGAVAFSLAINELGTDGNDHTAKTYSTNSNASVTGQINVTTTSDTAVEALANGAVGSGSASSGRGLFISLSDGGADSKN